MKSYIEHSCHGKRMYGISESVLKCSDIIMDHILGIKFKVVNRVIEGG